MSGNIVLALLLTIGSVPVETGAEAEQPAAAAGTGVETAEGAKRISGMSILGNQEAPTSLVIVPWKSSEIGEALGISTMLDDSRQPVDREVFMRALSYYEIRSESLVLDDRKQ
ncbi:MAG: hypothetical protein IFK94_09185 [Acidobacteria bacterium]|uniref:Uncharacterized protein n=1 Tax=Candidatus Polarisedimenticola svalbardensis TaxID=2886004 RepID=A0A8J6XX91_9BACT|nr:hypothetical protein [Candidatus Polarisedimenticola svalbardensis]